MASFPHNHTKVFISYNHKDTKYLHELLPHLENLEKDKLIDIWADTKIKPGEKRQDEIEAALAASKVAILLISIDFLNSAFFDNKFSQLLAAAEAEGVTIFPVILRHCIIPESLLRFQAINSPSRPLSNMKRNEREKLWVRVAKDTLDKINKNIQNDFQTANDRYNGNIEVKQARENAEDFEGKTEMLHLMQNQLIFGPTSITAKHDKVENIEDQHKMLQIIQDGIESNPSSIIARHDKI